MAKGGDSVSPEGVDVMGTITCFAVTDARNAPVALTAMHLVAQAQLRPTASLRFSSPCLAEGSPQFLGTLYRGTLQGTDAAAILLADLVLPTMYIKGIGIINGCRAPTEADKYKPVRVYGAFSKRVMIGRVESAPMAMPELDLDEAVLLALDSQPGDSGAPIVAKDGYVIGLLKGRYEGSDGLAVAASITSALRAVQCHVP